MRLEGGGTFYASVGDTQHAAPWETLNALLDAATKWADTVTTGAVFGVGRRSWRMDGHRSAADVQTATGHTPARTV